MTAGEEEQNNRERKGFAGLSSLVSDVDTSLPPPANQEAAGTGPATSAAQSTTHENARPALQPSRQQPAQAPSQSSSASSAGKWVLGICAVIGMLSLIIAANNKTTSPAPAYSPAPSYAAPAENTVPSYSDSLASSQGLGRPQETQPPVGQNLVFSPAQIRYCLAEKIRMDGSKSALDNYSSSDVDQFNAMVADYNSRCGSFRYRSGALESARQDIEQYRSQLQAEGMSRFARSPSSSALPAEAPPLFSENVAPSGIEANTPSTLASLSFDEKDAIETACIVKRTEGIASYNKCVTAQLGALANAPRHPDLSGLSSDEKDAIETACIVKRSQGAASYNRCVTAQLGALANAPRHPDLSGLSSDEKDAIETACIIKRSDGAASYNRCLIAQLDELVKAPRQPDMSGLSFDEKDAIETACILKRSEGAASYNRCLVAQVRAVERQKRN